MGYRFLQKYDAISATHSTLDASAKAKFERHCHSTHELLYILQGGGKYIVEGVEYPLHSHTLLLMHPYEYHYVCPDASQPYERTVIHFDKALLPEFLQSHDLLCKHGGNYFPLQSIDHPIRATYALMENLVALSGDGMQRTPEAEALLHSLTTQIILLLTQEKPAEASTQNSELVLQIIEYLNNHLCEDISLEAIAHELFISKYHLCRVFRAHTGASIFTYFTTKRMARARQMLADGESATTVATHLGFRDYSTFYRAYRKQFGESPTKRLTKK